MCQGKQRKPIFLCLLSVGLSLSLSGCANFQDWLNGKGVESAPPKSKIVQKPIKPQSSKKVVTTEMVDAWFREGVAQMEKHDFVQARALLAKAVDHGHAQSSYYLAQMDEKGLGAEPNLKGAFQNYKKAANQEVLEAYVPLARCYAQGKGTKRNLSVAFNWYLKGAEKGDSEAQNAVAQAFLQGRGTKTNPTRALYWFEKSAQQGNAEAQYQLGQCYANGRGTILSYEKAVLWYQKAVDQNYGPAMVALANLYEDGKGVRSSSKDAFRLYKAAADQQEPTAYFQLAHCYEEGIGVSSDFNAAVYWHQQAAEAGDKNSQYFLGELYLDGKRDILKDRKAAARWMEKAADNGHEKAQKIWVKNFCPVAVAQGYAAYGYGALAFSLVSADKPITPANANFVCSKVLSSTVTACTKQTFEFKGEEVLVENYQHHFLAITSLFLSENYQIPSGKLIIRKQDVVCIPPQDGEGK